MLQSLQKLKPLFLSLWVTISCCVNLQLIQSDSNKVGRFFLNAFAMKPFHIIHLILFFALLSLFHHLSKYRAAKEIKASVVISIIFSLFLLVGYSYETTGSMALIYGFSNGQSLKALLFLSGHIVLFYHLINYLYSRFDDLNKLSKAYSFSKNHFFSNHVFLKVIIILSLCYLPYIIASYPAIFMNDETFQIIQTYPESGVVSLKYLEGHLLNDSVTLNQHFPILHTLYISAFVKFGVNAFSSANLGIFLYCIVQMLFLFTGIAYLIKVLNREFELPHWIYWVILVYYVFSPRIHNYMMVTAKDVIYSGFMLFFLTFFAQLLIGKKSTMIYVGLSVSALGLYFNRNDARYLLILLFVALVIVYHKKYLTFALAGIATVSVITVLLSSVIFPRYYITPGTKAEMLSVPFQQTARYVRDYGNEVTPDEKAAISGVLEYDSLAKTYNPSFADPVKLLYDLDSDSEDLKIYFSTWLSMFKKHPAVYISATLHNYYQYFFPSKEVMEPRTYEYSQRCFNNINPVLKDFGVHFSYPKGLTVFRNAYQSASRALEQIFPLNVLTLASFFNWLLILLLGYHLSRKNKNQTMLLLYPLLVFLLVFVSPCNGYFCRYTYPLILITPIYLLSLLMNSRKEILNTNTTPRN